MTAWLRYARGKGLAKQPLTCAAQPRSRAGNGDLAAYEAARTRPGLKSKEPKEIVKETYVVIRCACRAEFPAAVLYAQAETGEVWHEVCPGCGIEMILDLRISYPGKAKRGPQVRR